MATHALVRSLSLTSLKQARHTKKRTHSADDVLKLNHPQNKLLIKGFIKNEVLNITSLLQELFLPLQAQSHFIMVLKQPQAILKLFLLPSEERLLKYYLILKTQNISKGINET